VLRKFIHDDGKIEVGYAYGPKSSSARGCKAYITLCADLVGPPRTDPSHLGGRFDPWAMASPYAAARFAPNNNAGMSEGPQPAILVS
jgi:hypothetical protein